MHVADETKTKRASFFFQVSAHNKGVIGDGMVGLGNLGNTCYINSSVQCLSHTPLLTEYFLSSAYVNDVNVENKLGLQVGTGRRGGRDSFRSRLSLRFCGYGEA